MSTSSEAEVDLLVLGDINPDLVLTGERLTPAFGQVEQLLDGASLTIGGSGAIVACGAARLGLSTAIAGVVGDDLFGRFMTDALAERGVDVSAVIARRGSGTGLTVILAEPDDRAMLTFAGTTAALTADGVDRDRLRRARHIHAASFYLQTALAPDLAELFAAARACGATTSLDPNWDPSQEWDGGLTEVLRQTDVFLPNAQEACRIARRDTPGEAARVLADAGIFVVVKLGAEGALLTSPGADPVTVAPALAVTPIDSVGAGDSFDAGLIAGLLGGESAERAVALGCACGALSTLAAGGTDAQPTLHEARALLG